MQVLLGDLPACGRSLFRCRNGRSEGILDALTRRIKHWPNAIDALTGIDLPACGSRLERLACGLEQLRRAKHLCFGLRERLKLRSQRGIAEGEGGKLGRWERSLGFINLRVAVEQIVV